MATSKKYEIALTEAAFSDLGRIYVYIKDNIQMPDTAQKQLARIERAILKLEKYPFSCSQVSDEFLLQKGYRKLIVDNYIAFYIADEANHKVTIMRILYGAQKYDTIL